MSNSELVPQQVNAMLSHFDNVLGVDGDDLVLVKEYGIESTKARLDAEKIINAFETYDGDNLPEKILDLLTAIASEAGTLSFKGAKALYDQSDTEEEAADALSDIKQIKDKFVFFTYVLTRLREFIVDNYNDAHEDIRHFQPKFNVPLGRIQGLMQDYSKQIIQFNEFLQKVS